MTGAVGNAVVLTLLACVEGDCEGVLGGVGDLAVGADAGVGESVL